METRTVKLIKSDMWPVKPAMEMQSNRPAIPIKDKKSKIVPQEDNKTCQSTKCIESKYDNFRSQSTVSSDKNCQENINMWPIKPAMNMQSNRPAVPICNKMSKKQIVQKVDDKNCQENINMRQ